MGKKKEVAYDDLEHVVIYVPKNAKKLKIEAKLQNGHVAEMKLDREGINEAREMYLELDPYDDAFMVYTLTDKGRESIDI